MEKMYLRRIGKSVFLVVLSIMLLIGSVACGNSNTKEDSTAASTTENNVSTATPTEQKPVTIKLISNSNAATIQAFNDIGKKFKQANPNITLEVSDPGTQYAQTVQTRMAANDVDLIMGDFFYAPLLDWNSSAVEKTFWQNNVDNGIYLDLTGQPFLNNYQKAANDAFSFNGKQYGIGLGIVGYNGLFYNKSIFEENSLTAPQTWDEFVALCEALKAKGITPMTAAGKDGWPYDMMMEAFVEANISDVNAYGKQLFLGEKKLNDPDTLKIYEMIDKFNTYMEKGFSGVDYNSVVAKFATGKVAMLPDGTWRAADISKANPDMKYGYFVIPGMEKRSDGNVPQLAGKFDYGLSVVATIPDDRKSAALKFMDFISQKENYTIYANTTGFLPTQEGIELTNEFSKTLEPMLKDFRISFGYNVYKPKGLGQYGSTGYGFGGRFLKSAGGPIATAKDLADLAAKDWADAIKANNK